MAVDKSFTVNQEIVFTRSQWGLPDRKGRIASLWSWPLVSVQLWSCELGRYVYGNTSIHERFLRLAPGVVPVSEGANQ